MRQMIKSTIFKTCGLCFLLMVTGLNLFSHMIANESEAAYQEPYQPILREIVMEAAGSFLLSHSSYLSFLQKIELSELNGLDYSELGQIIGNTITAMENARVKYTDLVQQTENTPYDQDTTAALRSFYFQSFAGQKKLNDLIFSKVEAYLGNGDTRGVYEKILSDTQDILDRLASIKSAVDSGSFPSMSDLWRVNQNYSETLLFGQYTAEVFYQITGK
jgi:hypothetical protein